MDPVSADAINRSRSFLRYLSSLDQFETCMSRGLQLPSLNSSQTFSVNMLPVVDPNDRSEVGICVARSSRSPVASRADVPNQRLASWLVRRLMAPHIGPSWPISHHSSLAQVKLHNNIIIKE